MSIFITNNIYLAQPGNGVNRPILAWHSVLRLQDITAQNAVADRPASNLWAPDTANFWQGNGLTNYITLHNVGNVSVDYVAFVKHNLGSKGIPYAIQKSDDNTTYTTIVAAKTLANDNAVLEYFTATTASFIRIVFSVSTPAGASPIVGHVRLGQALVLPRNIYVDHAPATLTKHVDRVSQISESGQYLGQIITRTKHKASVNQENISPDFIRAAIVPFIAHCNGTRVDDGTAQATFFFAWRPTDYPSEVIYGWTHDTITPTNQRNNGMMKFSFSMEGVA